MLAVFLEGLVELVAHLTSDVSGDFLHVGIALQITTADIQRNVGRVDHTMKQRQEVWHNTLNLVGDEHLIAVELNLIALQVNVALDAWEVENTSQVEGIVHIQVNPEQRLILHGIKLAVELLVVLILQRRWGLRPQRHNVIDNIVLIGILHLAVFPFLLLAKHDGHRHELAVLVEQFLNLRLLKILLAVVGNVKNHVGTAVGLLCIIDLECW